MVSTSRMTAVSIRGEDDVAIVNSAVRTAATRIGFADDDAARIAGAASELARNIALHADRGGMVLSHIEHCAGLCLELEFSDEGPGIDDLDRASEEGYSTVGRMGSGLPRAIAVMDDLQIRSKAGRGTRVVARKCRRK